MWGNRYVALLAAPASILTLKPDSFTPKSVKREKYNRIRERIKEKVVSHIITQGVPGLSIGITINGRSFYAAGYGFANVETRAPCTSSTVMRVGSISKPITSAIAARAVQNEVLDLDKPIQNYLPDFPVKEFKKKDVCITTRQLLSHISGIRHYEKKKREGDLEESTSTQQPEFFLNKKFKKVSDALELFKNDELLAEPGKEFNYTTHGFTIVSAILEKAYGLEFPKLIKQFCQNLGLHNTFLDDNKKVIPNRTSYYVRSKRVLENCPEVDNSYKWAGGGLLSNVRDLLVFGNAMMYSFQCDSRQSFIRKHVLDEFWKGDIDVDNQTKAALGWMKIEKELVCGIDDKDSSPIWYHTGAAVGASSVLLISPNRAHLEPQNSKNPDGICIVMLCNLQDNSLLALARDIESILRDEM